MESVAGARAGIARKPIEPLEDVDMKACAGDWIEVLSKEEILRTLDKNGRLDKVPFKYCGCE